MHNKFVASSVYQKNVVDHIVGTKELELCEELSEEEMMSFRGGISVDVDFDEDDLDLDLDVEVDQDYCVYAC